MKQTIKLPGLSQPVSDVIAHFAAVFLLAFGTQVIAGATTAVNISSLFALLTSAAAAGLVSVAHVVEGLIPVPANVVAVQGSFKRYTALGISLKAKTRVNQVVISALSTFLVILGSQLVGGAAGIQSLPDVTAVILSAIAAAVTGLVTYLLGLIPAPST